MNQQFKEELERLKAFTRDCRPDMHEPDEQGIDAIFGPSHHQFSFGGQPMPTKVTLDNAFTHAPVGGDGYTDMGFWLVNKDNNTSEWFNLADIIALARRAQ